VTGVGRFPVFREGQLESYGASRREATACRWVSVPVATALDRAAVQGRTELSKGTWLERATMDRGANITLETLSPAQLKSEKLRRLLAFWQQLRGGRPLPFRAEFTAEQIGFLLGQVTLVQVTSDPPTYRFRLVGTRIEEAGRRGDQNKTLDQIGPESYREALRAAYDLAATGAEPAINRIEIHGPQRRFQYEQVVLPFTVEGESVEMLLHAIDWASDVTPNFETKSSVWPGPVRRRKE